MHGKDIPKIERVKIMAKKRYDNVHHTILEFPINQYYEATYRDKSGEETVILHNDGQWLRMTVRGVEFVGWMLDDFELVEETSPDTLASFTLREDELCDYELEFDMPLAVVVNQETAPATLHVKLYIGGVTERGLLSYENFTFTLLYDETLYGPVTGEDFERGLLKLQNVLPTEIFIKACINCAWSDYGPGGNGAFGCMYCFRDNKAEYEQVHSKAAMFQLLMNTGVTEIIQETYLCPEFKQRQLGTGYRG